MTAAVPPVGLAGYAEAYQSGASVVEIIGAVLEALDAAPGGVLIGPPAATAIDDAWRLEGSDHRFASASGTRDVTFADANRSLFGVPFVVKDNIDVAGLPTTAACPGYRYIADRDADVVARLRAAGAVVVGKANLDQFATGLVGTRSPYGVPPNVLDPELVPGGSSSGSGVAVGLGLVPFSLGTDTAGSGRVPAALNGLVGYKPSVGRWPTHGVVPAVRRLDCPSVFARSVADAARVAAVIDHDPHPGDRPAGDAPARITVGVVADWPIDVEPATEIALDLARAVERLVTSGCGMVEVDPRPLLDLGTMLYGSALTAERSAAVGDAVVKQLEGLDPNVEAVIRRGFEHSAVDAYRAEHELVQRRAAAERSLAGVDVLVLPTTTHLPTLAAVTVDPLGENERVGRLTTFANLLGRPVVVVPVTPDRPTGVQLIGMVGGEALLEVVATRLMDG